MSLRATPYLRVSTSDKGQDPHRQMLAIEAWAEREGVTLAGPVIDQGTSATTTSPFERPSFMEAVRQAEAEGAAGIVVETGDRFTRQGVKLAGWYEVELERRHGLLLFRADATLKEQDTLAGAVTGAIKAEVARENMRLHSARVRSGMATAKRKGKRVGRPKKELSAEEKALALSMNEAGKGTRKIAQEINRLRGALDIYDPVARRRRSVSWRIVHNFLKAEGRFG